MKYLIAIASSDGINVDLPFGHAETFRIFGVDNDLTINQLDARQLSLAVPDGADIGGCGSGGCGNPVSGHANLHEAKAELIKDCRCVVCSCAGPAVFRALERRGVACFDVVCGVDEAISSIVKYYDKVDRGESLRKS